MDPAELGAWRRTGRWAFDHHARGRKEDLAYAFLEDAARHPAFPLAPGVPTLLVQGQRDDVVLPELARLHAQKVRAAGGALQLLEVDEGHELTADLPALWRAMQAHLQPWLDRAQAADGPGSGA